MIEIRPATTDDIPAIQSVAEVAFRATYAEILTPDQLDYMMEWMYSEASLRRQLAEGHHYFIAETDGEPCPAKDLRVAQASG